MQVTWLNTLCNAVFTVNKKGRRRLGVMAVMSSKTFEFTMSSRKCARREKGIE